MRNSFTDYREYFCLVANRSILVYHNTEYYMLAVHRNTIGRKGEESAETYLRSKGFRILSRNYRLGGIGEVDIIARDPVGVLVFVEVKSGTSLSDYTKPEEHFDKEKIWRVRRLAQDFVNRFPDYIDEKLGFRIDLVVAVFSEEGLSNNKHSEPVVRHYMNF